MEPPHAQDRVTGAQRRKQLYRGLATTISISVALGVIGFLFVLLRSPFSRQSVMHRIEQGTGLRAEAGSFRTSWFPPGFAAEDIRVFPAGTSGSRPLLTAKQIVIYGSYLGLLQKRKRITKLAIADAQVDVSLVGAQSPAQLFRGQAGGQSNPDVSVSEISIENSVLEVSPSPGSSALRFMIHHLALRNVGSGSAMPYNVAITNPRPHGEIHASGNLGPWQSNDAFSTPITGAFTFEQADLTVPHAISGILNAQGKFHGPLRSIACNGSADVPAFQVYGSTHPVHVAAAFDAVVNARNGDTLLRRVVAHYNQTTVYAEGGVTGTPGVHGKSALVNTIVQIGRVEDLLILFTSRQASLEGDISFQARFRIPPGPPDFLTRLDMDGDFAIRGARFTNPHIQRYLDRLGGSAAGERKQQLRVAPPRVRGDADGHVHDRGGVAVLSRVSFKAPGMGGELAGAFALHSKRISMTGDLRTRGKLQDTTSGLKSFLLKAASPLWKHSSVEKVPFHITGRSSHPMFRLALHR